MGGPPRESGLSSISGSLQLGLVQSTGAINAISRVLMILPLLLGLLGGTGILGDTMKSIAAWSPVGALMTLFADFEHCLVERSGHQRTPGLRPCELSFFRGPLPRTRSLARDLCALKPLSDESASASGCVTFSKHLRQSQAWPGDLFRPGHASCPQWTGAQGASPQGRN